MKDRQELRDGKNDKVDENDEGEYPSTDKDFCSGLFDGWNKTRRYNTRPATRLINKNIQNTELDLMHVSLKTMAQQFQLAPVLALVKSTR